MSYFYRTPACKALSLAVIAFSAFRYVNTALLHNPTTSLVTRLLATLTPSYPYCILPLIILWKYRVIERRLGSWQFIQLLFYGTLISLLLARVSRLFIAATEDEITHVFLSLICVLFPLFLAELPLQLDVVSLLVSENALLLFILIQALMLEENCIRAAVVSIAVGIILEQSWRTLHRSYYLSLPDKLREVGETLFKWFPDNRPPAIPWSGATLEVQRSQIMDHQEARLRNVPQQIPLGGWMGRRRWMGNIPRQRPRVNRALPAAPIPRNDTALPLNVTQEKVQQLSDMGFDRANSMIALSHSGGEVDLAAAILIAEKS
ncbi:Ubiquitin-associated domain-containing protein 2 [Oopsacas minuta]|uniref:Ubiquitin-associated domain-containing protein 2 n=1 Tax=Oopsacas minuta TaxID=111878 RepID=A0AAV7K8Z1_9METZ|nr:Ubiquitin-associated domain-containing protein 2 [Oopsacas minuta]